MTGATAGSDAELTQEPVAPSELLVQHVPRLHLGGQVYTSNGDYRDTIAWWNAMQDAPVGGQRLVDATRFDGVSMWQFLPSYMWPAAYWAVELVKALDALIEDGAPPALRAVPPADRTATIFRGVIEAYGAARGIKVSVGPQRGVSRARRAARAAGLGRLQQVARELGRGAAPEVPGTPSAVPDGPRALLISLPRYWAPDPADPGRSRDEQFGPLLEPLRQSGFRSFAGIDCAYEGVDDAAAILRDRNANEGEMVPWRAFESYPAPTRGVEREARRHLRGAWRQMRADLGSLGEFHGVAIAPALRDELRGGLTSTLPRCAALRATARAILDSERPDAIVAAYEAGPLERALVVEGARIGVPAVGLMHGMIFENHYDYMHAGVGRDPSEHAFAIPRRTCVWGPAWARSLTEHGHYPPDAVTVTGNWRYDGLAATHERRADLRQRLGVGDGTSLVAVLSSIQHTPEFVTMSLDAVESIAGAEARVRLHPGDQRPPVRDLIARRGLPASTLVDDGTLADLLVAADAVISQISSVVAESILIGRPVVLVDPIGSGRSSGYDAAGACHIVRDTGELPAAVDRVLHDDDLRAQLAAGRREYVEDHFFRLDGKAGERVAQTVAEVAGL